MSRPAAKIIRSLQFQGLWKPRADPTVRFDNAVDYFGAAVVLASRGEVGQDGSFQGDSAGAVSTVSRSRPAACRMLVPGGAEHVQAAQVE